MKKPDTMDWQASTLIVGLLISITLCQDPVLEWPWSSAHIVEPLPWVGVPSSVDSRPNSSLAIYILHDNQSYTQQDWIRAQGLLDTIMGEKGDEIQVGCKGINTLKQETGQIRLTVTSIKNSSLTFSYMGNADYSIWLKRRGPISCTWDGLKEGKGDKSEGQGDKSDKAQCELQILLEQSVSITCLWVGQDRGASHTLILRLVENPTTQPPKGISDTSTTPFLGCKGLHDLTFIGPHVIKQSNEQKLLLDPTYSLKKIQINLQVDVSHIQKSCQPYIQQSLKGWNAWLTARSHHTRTRRDVPGWIGTGLGVLNTIDQEALVNKLSTITSDLGKLQVPLRSSMLTLAETQSLAVKLITLVSNHTDEDFAKIIDYTGNISKEVALAIQCIQTQQWVQSVAAGILREGTSGILPQEIREIIAKSSSTTQFEAEHQAWWQLVNFTYSPQHKQIEAYVLTINAAREKVIFPVLALGVIHQDVIVRPIGHNVWASYDPFKNKWQSVSTEACIAKGQLGYICENAVVENEDLCLDAEDSVCTFEMLPHDKAQSQVFYIGNGCACVRTTCIIIAIDNCYEMTNSTNFCVCNFTRIVGCDFSYTVPITTQQLLAVEYTLYHNVPRLQIGMDTNLLKTMLRHPDIEKPAQEVSKTTQRMLWQVEHDSVSIKNVLTKIEQVGEHDWWDIFTRYSPTAMQVFHYLVHPMLIIIGVILLLSLLNVWLWCKSSSTIKRTPVI